jgi:hypothetical protein
VAAWRTTTRWVLATDDVEFLVVGIMLCGEAQPPRPASARQPSSANTAAPVLLM